MVKVNCWLGRTLANQKRKARKFEPKNIVIKIRLLNDFQTLWCRCRCYFLGTITDIFTSIETTQISLAVWIFFAHRPTLVHGKIGSAYCLSIGWWQLRTTIFLMLQNVWKSPKKSNFTHFTKLRSKQDKKMRIIVPLGRVIVLIIRLFEWFSNTVVRLCLISVLHLIF